jgi:vitamin B12 transporter
VQFWPKILNFVPQYFGPMLGLIFKPTNMILPKKVYLLALALASMGLQAQITISGKVNSKKNKPAANVNVSIKDSYDGATTDKDGNFSFITNEKGIQKLEVINDSYEPYSQNVDLSGKDLKLNIQLKAVYNDINTVVISVGAFEASDKKRATALLTPIDVYTTPGADGQISSALNFLPGSQKVGESEGLFVRGGTAGESKVFIDGSLVNNYFGNSVPGLASRERFATALFKGNVFSTGGYSALYGQALSSALNLESIDLPEKSSIDAGISPFFLFGQFQELNDKKTHSFGVSASYVNLEPMVKLLKYNANFDKAPVNHAFNANFRQKLGKTGFIKYYTSYDANQLQLNAENLNLLGDTNKTNLDAHNFFQNLNYNDKIGRIKYNIGLSHTFNENEISNKNAIFDQVVRLKSQFFNLKPVFETKLFEAYYTRFGAEWNHSYEQANVQNTGSAFGKTISQNIYSAFVETDVKLSQDLSARIGARTEYADYLGKWNAAPRLALTYNMSKEWLSSLAYGRFFQNAETRYLGPDYRPNFQYADHYILQIQRKEDERTLRLEAFYKDYHQLIKTQGGNNNLTAINNLGSGVAKGAELFWRDKKTFSGFDYWLSYSYLDGQREFLNYPQQLFPNFAAKHTGSLVLKKFFMDYKTGINASYQYTHGRPYYDISNAGNLRQQGILKDYNSLNLSLNYLPNLGKTDSNAFVVFVLSVNNVLGTKNVYGYNFSQDGLRQSPVLPPVNTSVFIGCFISFGVDRTQEAINNNL